MKEGLHQQIVRELVLVSMFFINKHVLLTFIYFAGFHLQELIFTYIFIFIFGSGPRFFLATSFFYCFIIICICVP